MAWHSPGWWVGLASFLFGAGLRPEAPGPCVPQPPRLSVTRESATSEPLLSAAFDGRLDPSLKPLDAFLRFFDEFPGIGERLVLDRSSLQVQVVPTSPLENRIAFVGQRLPWGIPMEYGDLRFQFAADTRAPTLMSFYDVAGWSFDSQVPRVSGAEAGRIASGVLVPILGPAARVRTLPGLIYVVVGQRRFALAWRALVEDEAGSLVARLVDVDAGTGQVLRVVPAIAGTDVPATMPFIRGDAYADGVVDVSDAVAVLRFLFAGASDDLSCLDAADANADHAVNVTDAVLILRYLFEGDRPPEAPFPSCGISVDGDGCVCHAACR